MLKKESFIVLETNDFGYKIFIPARAKDDLPKIGELLKVFTYFQVKEDGQALYGFLTEKDLDFFEKLITVNGVGPKSALAVMSIASSEQLAAAIVEGKIELLSKASGVGRRTAERIILELKGKLSSLSGGVMSSLESDLEVEEALIGLGYSRQQARRAIDQIDKNLKGLELKIKAALKALRK